ncbi:YagU family protein [Rothia kristinae]|uniref:YagU family protein n=1 Tax=Rothia kristinae TaxID=37923 RepID=UPI0011A761A2|nr:YagU family protein [Rothia kristinae]
MSAATLLRTVTDPVRRRPAVAVLIGVIAGIFSGIVKFGWEVPFPPRSPERNATNPPQALLELLGMSPEATHQTYTYLGNDLPWVSFIVHFAFAISFAVLYCVIAEYRPGITLWQGAVFGLAVWVAFHLVVMPLMGIVPAPWEQPFGEHFSEALGHVVWAWSIEIVRRDLRSRITGQPDPWVRLPGEAAG